MNSYKFDIYFRVFHPEIDPDEIAKRLRMSPRRKWLAGTQRRTPKGRSLSGGYDSSFCLFALLNKENKGLMEVIELFLNRLEKQKAFLSSICKSGGRLEVYVSLFL